MTDELHASTARILGMLKEKYRGPHWIGIEELRAGTGFSCGREIDLYCISQYARDGYGYSIAFEIKVSKSDFKNEIADPDKRAPFVENSNQFYYVTPPGILDPGEIPQGCGLMECGKSIRVIKIAEQRDVNYSPIFVASIIKRLTEKPQGEEKKGFRLFKFAGKDLTEADLEAILLEHDPQMKTRLSTEARESVRKLFQESAASEYNKLVRGICEIYGLTQPPEGWSWREDTHPIWDVNRLLEIIQRTKDNLMSHDRHISREDLSSVNQLAKKIMDILGKEIQETPLTNVK
jgi:hypothetical protein